MYFGKKIEEIITTRDIIKNLEENAQNILEFMASNGLTAKTNNTLFMMLIDKEKQEEEKTLVKVGQNKIERSGNTKLLGMQIEDSQEWDIHFKNIICSLNQRFFIVRRISKHIPKSKIMNVVHGLCMSKLRYGLQLCNKVKITDQSIN